MYPDVNFGIVGRMKGSYIMVYQVQLMVADKVPVAPEGMRTVVLRWKSTKDKVSKKVIPALSPKKWVIVPEITSQDLAIVQVQADEPVHVMEYIEERTGFIRELVETEQKEFIQELVTERIKAGYPLPDLSESEISLSALIQASKADSSGRGRMSGDMLEQWFKDELLENLFNYVMEQKGGEGVASITEVETVVKKYADYYSSFAKTTYIVHVGVAKKLHEVLWALVEDQESRCFRFLDTKLKEQMVELTAEDVGL